MSGLHVLDQLGGQIAEMDMDLNTKQFIENMRNASTKWKTKTDVDKFVRFLQGRNEVRHLHELSDSELDAYLAQYFLSVKRDDGENYEPSTLTSIQSSIMRHLRNVGREINLKTDSAFHHSREVVVCRKKLLKQLGHGNKTNQSQAFTKEEINILWEKNILGNGKFLYYNKYYRYNNK